MQCYRHAITERSQKDQRRSKKDQRKIKERSQEDQRKVTGRPKQSIMGKYKHAQMYPQQATGWIHQKLSRKELANVRSYMQQPNCGMNCHWT